jgi:hypothetical protein
MTDTQPSLFDAAAWADAVESPHVEPAPTVLDAFEAFHATNPHVYRALVQLARDLKNRGHERIGIGMLFEVLRWQAALVTSDSGFKLNNSYRAYYARHIMDTVPELDGIFETRGGN